ncbi:MAG TPA: MFS transporter [Gemmataceae bacterium]|nr:MFS transporter [Gemmataceae bacterium]
MGTTSTVCDARPARRARWLHGYDGVILLVAALAMVGTLPGRTHGLGLFTKAILRDFHIEPARFGTINLWATLLGAVFCLPFGKLLDRFGTGRVLTAVALALGGVVLSMSHISGEPLLFVTIALTRGLGQSALSVVSLAIVGKWFTRRVGQAMGIYSLLVGLGFIAAFAALREILPRVEWVTVWSGMGWILILGLAPCGLLLFRKASPVGSATQGNGAALHGAPLAGFSLGQALQTPAFWVFGIASSVYLLISSGVSLFNELILDDLGFDSRTYHTALLYSTATALASNFLGGWLAARWSMGRVMGLALGCLTGALLAFPRLRTETHVFVQAAVMGMAGGVVTVVFFAVWSQAFGRAHLGKIQGVAQMLTVIASAAGPLVFAECKRLSGAYTLMFYSLAPLTAALGLCAWLVRLPHPAEASQNATMFSTATESKGELEHAGNLK